MNLEKIGKFIAESRKKQQLTQAELAEKLNVTYKAVSKWFIVYTYLLGKHKKK